MRLIPRGEYMRAPRDLTVTGVESRKVYLSWTAAPSATHYKVQYRDPLASAAWLPNTGPEIITTATTAVIDGLTTDRAYEFRVIARDLFEVSAGSGTVAWIGDDSGTAQADQHASNIVTGTPLQPLTITPTGLMLVGYRDTEVHLRWTPVAGAMYYIVQYRRKDTALRPIENWLDYGERFVTASGALTQLETGTQYEFRVKAFNTHVVTSSYLGYSGPSASIFGTPLARLAAPANLMLIAAGTGDWTGECAGSCTASAGSTRSSVVLHATASTRDGFYNGTVIRMLSGAVRDASAQIVAYDAPTRTARLSRAFAVAPAAGDGYMISRYPLGEDRVTITWTRVDAAAQYMVSVRQADRSEEYAQAGGP